MNQNDYNGWTNYETWVVNLWMTNDQGSCSYWEEVTNDCDSISDLSDAIKDYVEEGNSLSDESSLYSDLMNAAISECNFYEIAKSFWEDYKVIDEDEDDLDE
jgi:hypothetical protein